jgi:chromosome segregation ATPase
LIKMRASIKFLRKTQRGDVMSDFAINPNMVYTQAGNDQKNEGFSFKSLLDPASLFGRVCDNWKPLAAVVLVVIGVVTSIFAASLFNIFLFASLGGITSILIRDIRDLGTYKELNKTHDDINADQELNCMQLAAQVDGLEEVRAQLAAQNKELAATAKDHAAATEQQRGVVKEQRELLVATAAERQLEIEAYERALAEQKEQMALIEEQRRAIQAESAKVKEEVRGLLQAMTQGSGTLQSSVAAVVKAQAALTQAGDVAQEGAEAVAGRMGEHAEAFRAAVAKATLDHEHLDAVRLRFLELMTVEEAKLAPLRELLEQAQQNPRDMLQTAAVAQDQLRATTQEHARLTAEVAALTEKMTGLKAAVSQAEESFQRSAANIENVTVTLVTARNDVMRTAQAAALQQQQRQSGAGHHGAGALPPSGFSEEVVT